MVEKVYIDPYRKKYGSPTMPKVSKGFENKRRMEEFNKKAKEIAQEKEEVKYQEGIEDLIQEAKRSGNYDLASELIDKRIEMETREESKRTWDRFNIRSGGKLEPENLTNEVFKKLRESGDLDYYEEK